MTVLKIRTMAGRQSLPAIEPLTWGLLMVRASKRFGVLLMVALVQRLVAVAVLAVQVLVVLVLVLVVALDNPRALLPSMILDFKVKMGL